MSVYSKSDQDAYKGGKMKPDRSTKGIKMHPHFGTKRIKNTPKDQNLKSYP